MRKVLIRFLAVTSEDWGSVVTFHGADYGADARKLLRFFGNENPRNGRVVLVDPEGIIRWVRYSARVLLELDAAVRAMHASGEKPDSR